MSKRCARCARGLEGVYYVKNRTGAAYCETCVRTEAAWACWEVHRAVRTAIGTVLDIADEPGPYSSACWGGHHG